MANFTRKTITLSERKVVNLAQKIQRDYYNKIREVLATASDAQIDLFEKAVGADDTQAAFAVKQEREARQEGMLGFTVFEKPAEVQYGEVDGKVICPGCDTEVSAPLNSDGLCADCAAEDDWVDPIFHPGAKTFPASH